MRKYLTEKEREKFRLIIINAKKQHLEKFEIEDYCKDNDIDYNIIASEVDSIRYSVKIENLDKKSKDFYDDKQKRTNGTSKHIHFQDDSSRA